LSHLSSANVKIANQRIQFAQRVLLALIAAQILL